MHELEGAPEYDYIVIGSGAGGGPLAGNLARAGYTVLVLEAGGDTENVNYRVPAFHPKASEDPSGCWNFFVRHYECEERQARDPKYRAGKGVLYPRSGALGGCTSHNAMIFMYPHNADWEHIADLTGDPSWRAVPMRALFQRLEDCRYRPIDRFLRFFGWNPARHGFRGWLPTESALPLEALRDRALVETVVDSAAAAASRSGHEFAWLRDATSSLLDPNAWDFVAGASEGLCFTPLTTRSHARNGSREYLQATAKALPGKLRIEIHALASRVLLDEGNVARGVEYLSGARLYRAHPEPSGDPGVTCRASARREVIVCGGAYNTPQLLMLSGIGPRDELQRHGIRVRVELPGVGRNLQDRYEVGVITRLKKDWEILKGASYGPEDPQFVEWDRQRTGMYTTNGAILAMVRKSSQTRALPDLFLMGLIGNFAGYEPGYAAKLMERHDYLTWTVLKAHTKNNAGTVSLSSSDPRDVPIINFRYFEEGSDTNGEDLDAVVSGVKFARGLTKGMTNLVAEEVLPGESVRSKDEIEQFVRDHAWGHHASCTCKIGRKDDRMAVLDGDFRVYGVDRLRVVDASAFPRIPGFFPVAAVYMLSEKATDAILKDARTRPSIQARPSGADGRGAGSADSGAKREGLEASALSRIVPLDPAQRVDLAWRKGSCPFIGSGIAKGLLAVRHSTENPLITLDDVRRLGDAGPGSNLGTLVADLFAAGNHASMFGPTGRLDRPVPKEMFSANLPGSQGAHAGHSGMLMCDPRALDSGRSGPDDAEFTRNLQRLTGRAKDGLLTTREVGQYIAENLARDPNSKVLLRGDSPPALGSDLHRLFGGLGEALLAKITGGDPGAARAEIVSLTKVLGDDNLMGSSGEFGLFFAFCPQSVGGEPAITVKDLRAMFGDKELPAAWETSTKTVRNWVIATAKLVLAAAEEYRQLPAPG